MRLATAWVVIGILIGQQSARAASPADVAKARDLGQVGKHAEALEAFEALARQPDNPPAIRDAIALGRAESLDATGEPDKALAALREVAEAPNEKGENPDLWARIARIQLDHGDWIGADQSSKRALKASPDHLLGRWVQALLLEARGELEGAVEACKWFVDYQAGHAEALATDAPALLLVGQAAEKYIRARFRQDELSEELNKVINNVYEVALKADPNCWQAHWLEGKLFLSGYQEGDARRDLTKALKINPRAAEVIVTLGQADLQGYKLAAGRKKAERALEINPRMVAAHVSCWPT